MKNTQSEKNVYLTENVNESERLKLQVNAAKYADSILKKNILEFIIKKQNGPITFLDAGCGPCHISEELQKLFPQMIFQCIDNSEDRVKKAQARLSNEPNIHIEQGDVVNLQEDDNSYDVVFSRFVLDHLKQQQQQIVDGFFKILKPGGIIILQSVDHGLGIHYPEDVYLGIIKQQLYKKLHENNYDPNTGRCLKALVGRSGFELVRQPIIELYKLYSFPLDEKEFKAYRIKLENGFPFFVKAFGNHNKAEDAMKYLLDYVQRPGSMTYSISVLIVAQKLQ
ncbi:MAG: class I SAM-dependent methyltransferase [Deltaproteobacteria bacterium]|jgi:ubiquinone/menaquinone biosynthesis C-methylase UbiE|nr:class I SAM-dependent methyltransferase [Deltaproteobacteria bacterium]MBT4525554.1 class I SAM-dependent methyltransferase [Deltaproteobacteria bacterium]